VRVFFLPWNKKNPYQQNLAEALALHDVEVTGCESRKFLPVLSLLWRYGRPDVLHLHWISGFLVSRFRWLSLVRSTLLLAELLVIRLLGVRIVWTIHNLVEHKKRDVRFELRVSRLVARYCDRFVVHCVQARRSVMDAFQISNADRITVIPHGNYLGSYPDEVEESAARARLGVAPGSFVYLFFGMVQPYKGIEELIEAFSALDDPEATLLLVGSCRNAKLEEHIGSAAKHDSRIMPVLRYVESDEVQYYMRAANAVVLPFSDVFTSGSAVLAMSFGRALVVPRLGCLPEYVDTRGGILYEPGAERLIEALQSIACADWQAMGSYNRKIAEQLDWGAIARQTFSAYRPEETSRVRRTGESARVGADAAAEWPPVHHQSPAAPSQ
jgi:beta-1,4-mannosyltransferase